ncbi:fumarylacetoacetase [Putridiphycobacter roseus]|uniref:fumarylacetoacetase n=1 Tax=Putridiphycobacter roseus TaxID=2219161 RepID=A0A2W1NFL1_9FLAO|nr:fumarylacetoacetase [Putridiphycobacter roseus]PZE16806.1 fumarylacetoacetase [Putridiphycobacter roseus]
MSIKVDNKDKSWVEVPDNSDFPIQNLPFGIFKTSNLSPRVGVAIGQHVLDLKSLFVLGYLKNLPFSIEDFDNIHLNDMMLKGKKNVSELRLRLYKLLKSDFPDLKNNEHHVSQVLNHMDEVEMMLPIKVGDYTDFYSSEQHAYNVGCLFRDPKNALMPNWKHIPVGYHGRASSIIVSGQPIHRPKGQKKGPNDELPTFGPSNLLDFELETVFYTFQGKALGDSISTEEADDYIFGMSLLNDWSARDIQGWEYVPLGPFLGKNFASCVSPWVVTMDALESFRIPGPVQEPKVLPYLTYTGEKHLDVNLDVFIKPENGEEDCVGQSNFKYMYWNMNQQLAHHSVNGCNINVGDAMGSGTISGPEYGQFGSMLETSWKGSRPFKMKDGTERKFILDNDTVIMRGYCEKDGLRIGFGEVSTKVLPAK